MDRCFPVKKAVETVTLQDLVAAVIFSGKRRQEAYNQAQKSAVFLQKRVLASRHRLLCSGSSDHCRILPYELHAIQHIVPPNLFAVLPRNTNLLQQCILASLQAQFTAREISAPWAAAKCTLSGQPREPRQ